MAGKSKSIAQQINKRALKHQNKAAMHGITITYREAKFMVLEDMFEDLPDGAYWQAFADNGYEPEDVINISDSLFEKGITRE